MDIESDWRYSDERMVLRADVFIKLKHYLKLKTGKHLYEFCHHLLFQGNKSTEGPEEGFLHYLKELSH